MLRRYRSSIRSFFKNIRKGKFYAIFRTFWDKEYRNQIRYMQSLTTICEMTLSHGSVPINSLIAGHSVNYPKWVTHLVNKINTQGYKKIEPIKVIWDQSQSKWLVVDGNHRFEAFKRTLPGIMKIPVFILRPKNIGLHAYQKEMLEQMRNKTFTIQDRTGKIKLNN